MIKGFPPQIVWIRLGNCTTDQIIEALINNTASVLKFTEDNSLPILVLK